MSRLTDYYTNISAYKIFEVGGRSSKTTKIMRLENLALYGIYMYVHTCAPLMMDWNPEPQSLLMVRAGEEMGTPDLRAACRARYPASVDDCRRREQTEGEEDREQHTAIHTEMTELEKTHWSYLG